MWLAWLKSICIDCREGCVIYNGNCVRCILTRSLCFDCSSRFDFESGLESGLFKFKSYVWSLTNELAHNCDWVSVRTLKLLWQTTRRVSKKDKKMKSKPWSRFMTLTLRILERKMSGKYVVHQNSYWKLDQTTTPEVDHCNQKLPAWIYMSSVARNTRWIHRPFNWRMPKVWNTSMFFTFKRR